MDGSFFNQWAAFRAYLFIPLSFCHSPFASGTQKGQKSKEYKRYDPIIRRNATQKPPEYQTAVLPFCKQTYQNSKNYPPNKKSDGHCFGYFDITHGKRYDSCIQGLKVEAQSARLIEWLRWKKLTDMKPGITNHMYHIVAHHLIL